MPQITIDISVETAKIIQRKANATGITAKQFVQNMLENWASGQINGFFIKKLNSLTLQQKIDLLGDIL